MVEIILKEDIAGLGYKNDIVKVRPGYARNFLIPKGYAITATESAKKIQSENIRQAAHKAEKIRKDAQELAEKIGDLSLDSEVKSVGNYGATLDLHKEVKHKIKFDVVED